MCAFAHFFHSFTAYHRLLDKKSTVTLSLSLSFLPLCKGLSESERTPLRAFDIQLLARQLVTLGDNSRGQHKDEQRRPVFSPNCTHTYTRHFIAFDCINCLLHVHAVCVIHICFFIYGETRPKCGVKFWRAPIISIIANGGLCDVLCQNCCWMLVIWLVDSNKRAFEIVAACFLQRVLISSKFATQQKLAAWKKAAFTFLIIFYILSVAKRLKLLKSEYEARFCYTYVQKITGLNCNSTVLLSHGTCFVCHNIHIEFSSIQRCCAQKRKQC